MRQRARDPRGISSMLKRSHHYLGLVVLVVLGFMVVFRRGVFCVICFTVSANFVCSSVSWSLSSLAHCSLDLAFSSRRAFLL